MNIVYPIKLTPIEDGAYMVTVPDLDIITEGSDLSDAISMARDAICLKAVTLQDIDQPVPSPSEPRTVTAAADEFVTLVDCDPEEYRRFLDNRSVKKNCTLPSWLERRAEAAHINFSAVLQEALLDKLGIAGR
jgi:predicted RNase H-like HicB family nuclease